MIDDDQVSVRGIAESLPYQLLCLLTYMGLVPWYEEYEFAIDVQVVVAGDAPGSAVDLISDVEVVLEVVEEDLHLADIEIERSVVVTWKES